MTPTTIDLNESAIKSYVESKRPKDPMVRKRLDFGYSYDGQTAIIFEIRPVWNNPEKIFHMECAKFKYIKSKKKWKLYWMRASGKWELYDPFPESGQLDKILKEIKEDKYGCFYG